VSNPKNGPCVNPPAGPAAIVEKLNGSVLANTADYVVIASGDAKVPFFRTKDMCEIFRAMTAD
jgi:hypothetical protein